MVQEYLINDEEEKSKICEHEFKQKDDKTLKITCNISEIPDTEAWIIAYSTSSNSEDAAKILSGVDEWVRKNSKAVILTNGSSAYFNKTLFPLINDFERGLRKLLYLMSAKHKDDDSAQNIKNLEEKDLGKIFELLFSDAEFSKNVRQLLKNKTWNFTKREILKDVEKIDEVTVWDQLVGKEIVPSLSQNFIEVKNDRNHVMHAHNIDYKTFTAIKKLYKTINNEIEEAIEKVTGKQSVVSPSFNESLSTVLKAFTEAIDTSALQEAVAATSVTPAMQQLLERLSSMQTSLYSENVRVGMEQLLDRIEKLNLGISNQSEKTEE